MALEERNYFSFEYADHEGDRRSFSFPAAGYGLDLAAERVKFQAVVDAVNGLTLGVRTAGELVERFVENATVVSSENFAQVGINWLVQMKDAVTGRIYTFKIPTADLALLQENANEIDYTDAKYTAFKTAIEAVYRTPEGNAATVYKMSKDGR